MGDKALGTIWTNEDVHYVLNDETPPGLNEGAAKDGWFLARKTALTPMLAVTGPVDVETQEGNYQLPEGWEGYIAVDSAHFPYPIAKDEFERMYERVSELRGASGAVVTVLPQKAFRDVLPPRMVEVARREADGRVLVCYGGKAWYAIVGSLARGAVARRRASVVAATSVEVPTVTGTPLWNS